MKIITRFAPSPSGPLHIGGMRTVLFNWLFTKQHQGKFMLRIEDTDRSRCKDEYVQNILDGLDWLGMNPEGEIVFQSKHLARYKEVLAELEKTDAVYRCYCEPNTKETRPTSHASAKCPCRSLKKAIEGKPYALRLKVPLEGETVINDLVQGQVKLQNSEINDLAIMRRDGTTTYMFSVVVDDHDSDITHVVRGDDHLTNSAKQLMIYNALGWEPPVFAHIALVHGSEGKKLSKRDGAVSVLEYRKLGYLPEAILSYLTRLGWSHGDQEIITLPEAVQWFDFAQVSRGAVKFSLEKLQFINAHYLRLLDHNDLLAKVTGFVEKLVAHQLSSSEKERISRILPEAKLRAKTLLILAEMITFACDQEISLEGKEQTILTKGTNLLRLAIKELSLVENWDLETLHQTLRQLSEREELSFAKLATVIRLSLTGKKVSPGISDLLICLGKELSLQRLNAQLS